MTTKFRAKIFKKDFKEYVKNIGMDYSKLKSNEGNILLCESVGIEQATEIEVQKNENYFIIKGRCLKHY